MSPDLSQPPAAQGYRMPAEWHPHRRCWMTWPVSESEFGDQYAGAEVAYGQVARAISRFEPVEMLVHPSHAERARLLCGPGVRIRVLGTSGGWFRDFGPSFLIGPQGELAAVHWGFNGYGGKYEAAIDAELSANLLAAEAVPRFAAPLVMEGGSFHVDGQGTLLTTAECLLNPNRNPDLTQTQIEQHLKDHLGVEHVIWLPKGLIDDETDGHVDNLACFAGPGRVLVLSCQDPDDPLHEITGAAIDTLRSARDAQGRALEVIEVPAMPAFYDAQHGQRLAMSHINFYLANRGLVIPFYGFGAPEQRATAAIASAWPNHAVVQVPTLSVLYGGGNIHCITQQEPVASPIAESYP